jgi:hypothetical protein
MKMKRTVYYIAVFLFLALLQACNLEEDQQSTADRAMIFGSETGLKTYTNSFYNMLPDYSNAFKQDAMSDYGAKNQVSTYEAGAYTPETSTSWSWGNLRNVNYFIKYNTDSRISETVRNNYTGIARFFRAYFYFDKLITYGEVPWIDEPLEPDDSRLYAARDTRDVIVRHILADLDSAYQDITESAITANSNTINKWTPLLFKSRVALFEASWRKYHANTDYVKNCSISSDSLYQVAADAARLVMDKGPYSIYTGTSYADGRGAYRELFISDNPVTSEVMLAVSLDKTLGMGEQNWWYNSSTYGPHLSMTRTFAKTYLNRDGTFYNEKNTDGTYKNFQEETTGRDLRLNQTIRGYDYTCKNAAGNYVRTAANYTGLSLTGYQFTKYVMDDVAYDDGRTNDNDIPIFRYAEVLLNYAEAKAELGTLTDEDWKNTIGVLRRRAGITGGDLDKKPTKVDPYLQETYYPDISDPVILEIRRERAIELCLEGLRMMDLKRWACGHLWKDAPWTGVYIPALDTPLDMNGDGTYDAYFTKDSSYKGTYKGIAVYLDNTLTVQKLDDDPKGGYILDYNETSHTWNDNMYLYPIPSQVISMNPNLTQNPGW